MLASWLKSAALGLVVMMFPLANASADVPKPVIQKAMGGDKCVEDPKLMRREHMEMLEHHRDETVHEGIRTKKYSLKNCINCHATPNEKGERTVLGKDHFCQSCHNYAAVKIDCFECHSSKPEGTAAMHPIVPAQNTPGAQAGMEMRHHAYKQGSSLGNSLSVKDLTGVLK